MLLDTCTQCHSGFTLENVWNVFIDFVWCESWHNEKCVFGIAIFGVGIDAPVGV